MPDYKVLAESIIAALPISDEAKKKLVESDNPVVLLTEQLADYEKETVRKGVELELKKPDVVKKIKDEGFKEGQGIALGKRDEMFTEIFGDLDLKRKGEDGKNLSMTEVYKQVREKLAKGNDATAEELRKELIAARKAASEKEMLYKTEVEKIHTDYSTKEKRRTIFDNLRGMLPKADTLALPVNHIETLMQVEFDRKYTIDLDANNEVKILKKDGSPITNDKGTAELSTADVVSMFAGQFKKQATGEPGSEGSNGKGNEKIKTGTKQGSPGREPSGLSKAQQHLANLEKA